MAACSLFLLLLWCYGVCAEGYGGRTEREVVHEFIARCERASASDLSPHYHLLPVHVPCRYNRTYAPGSQEYEERFHVFSSNLQHLRKLEEESLGGGSTAVWWGMTKFFDLTPAEFRNAMLMWDGGDSVSLH